MKRQIADIIGTKYGGTFSFPTPSCKRPTRGGIIAIPITPKTNCLPTSPRPIDVSLVAITQAVQKRHNDAAVNKSPRDLKLSENKKMSCLWISDWIKYFCYRNVK